jgi:hypothetical protein
MVGCKRGFYHSNLHVGIQLFGTYREKKRREIKHFPFLKCATIAIKNKPLFVLSQKLWIHLHSICPINTSVYTISDIPKNTASLVRFF